ncbi:MAG: hypothetical protein BWY93_00405 [Euryarchaeota archaeon ADurb.BinA087]|nr:MAG: hypothetical protein BWY93_00405 [Euryarchaeota archaeon ADurb.BinA087]
MPVTVPPATDAVADAPVPVLSEITTVGAEVYPIPPAGKVVWSGMATGMNCPRLFGAVGSSNGTVSTNLRIPLKPSGTIKADAAAPDPVPSGSVMMIRGA